MTLFYTEAKRPTTVSFQPQIRQCFIDFIFNHKYVNVSLILFSNTSNDATKMALVFSTVFYYNWVLSRTQKIFRIQDVPLMSLECSKTVLNMLNNYLLSEDNSGCPSINDSLLSIRISSRNQSPCEKFAMSCLTLNKTFVGNIHIQFFQMNLNELKFEHSFEKPLSKLSHPKIWRLCNHSLCNNFNLYFYR